MADTAAEAAKQAERAKQEKRELGRLTAVTLIEEMRFLGKLVETKSNDELIDFSEASKQRPDFQTISKKAAAKSNESEDIMADFAGFAFCVADGRVEQDGLFDIDHTHAFSDIERKQNALLTYLNNPTNSDFAVGFLSATGIEKYFGKHADGKIKGTWRFYKLCYNDIDNLLLLCHACNAHKSDKESLEWFGKQEPFLGKEFVSAVQKDGGLHDGIIVKKVMKKGDAKDLISINLGYELCLISELPKSGKPTDGKLYLEKQKDGKLKYIVLSPKNEKCEGEMDISIDWELPKKGLADILESKKSEILDFTFGQGHTGRVECTLHAGDTEVFGMGQYVRKWFKETNPEYREGILKAYKDIWLELKAIFEVRLPQRDDQYRQSQENTDKLVTVVESIIKKIDDIYGIKKSNSDTASRPRSGSGSSSGSGSGPDDADDTFRRIDEVREVIVQVFKQMRAIKKFYKTISSPGYSLLVKIDKKDIFTLLDASKLKSLGPAEKELALVQMQGSIMKLLSDGKDLTSLVLERIIKDAIDKNDPNKKLEDERREKEEARRQAEEKEQARIEAEHKLADKDEQLAAKDAELKSMRELVAQLQGLTSTLQDGKRTGQDTTVVSGNTTSHSPAPAEPPRFTNAFDVARARERSADTPLPPAKIAKQDESAVTLPGTGTADDKMDVDQPSSSRRSPSPNGERD